MRPLALVALMAGLIIGCAGPGHRDTQAYMGIVRAVRERIGSGGGPVRAGKALPGEWDRTEVAGPYTPPAVIEAKTGPDARIASSGIEARDDITLLVLLKGGSIVSVVSFPRGTADFSPLAGSSLAPDDCLMLRLGEPPQVERGSGC